MFLVYLDNYKGYLDKILEKLISIFSKLLIIDMIILSKKSFDVPTLVLLKFVIKHVIKILVFRTGEEEAASPDE